MFRRCSTLLGSRWRSDDFLKGRNKVKGAVHKRSILGSRGRMKQWTKTHGLRDGGRQQLNRTKGALGLRLGGGLFGLRIARNAAMKDMTREELDAELHGMSDITNTYRYSLDKHPLLDQVLTNPAAKATVLVAMPTSAKGYAKEPDVLPESWEKLVPMIQRLKDAQLKMVEKTNKTSDDSEPSASSSSSSVDILLCSTFNSVVAETTFSAREDIVNLWKAHRRARFVLRAIPEDVFKNAGGLGDDHLSPEEQRTKFLEDRKARNRAAPLEGIQLFAKNTPTRVTEVIPTKMGDEQEALIPTEAPPNFMNVLNTMQEVAPQSLRLVTKLDMTSFEDEVFVNKASNVDALFRWFYFSQDPRSHFNDQMGNSARKMPCTVVVQTEKAHKSVAGVLKRFGYQYTLERSDRALEKINKWSVDGTNAERRPLPIVPVMFEGADYSNQHLWRQV